MLERVSSSEFAEWQEFFIDEPFGNRAADLRAGYIVSMLYNVNRGPNQKALGPIDVIPWLAAERERQMSDEEHTMLIDRMLSAAKEE